MDWGIPTNANKTTRINCSVHWSLDCSRRDSYRDGITLRKVKVLNTETLQWSTATDLSQPLYQAPVAVCDDHLYVLGMYTCSLTTLTESHKSGLGASVWEEVAAPPVTLTTCVSVHGQLLAIGGWGSDGKLTTAIHMYHRTTDSWEVISHMATPRRDCTAAVLPNNQLMVVGGYTSAHGPTDSIEFASIAI